LKLHKAKAGFRGTIETLLDNARKRAARDGYSEDDIELAQFAVVAFLDEAVLHSNVGHLSNWEQMLGNDAGEVFFVNLERIRKRGNSHETADLLELYCACILLGFGGQYRVSFPRELEREAELRKVVDPLIARLRKSRNEETIPRPWLLPGKTTLSRPAPSLGYWLWLAGGFVLGAVLLFIVYHLWLDDGISRLRDLVK
jgi:type VI secretion system protein ImpK